MNGLGRDDGGPEISGFSLRSLPELLRLVGGRRIREDVMEHGAASEGLVMIPPLFPVVPYLPRVLLESKSGFCGGVVEG